MKRALFVSNGHGEASVADRIASELNGIMPDLALDHVALVGDAGSAAMHDVGPTSVMPSGGLIAMGNARNIARDVRAGLLGLTVTQFAFLRSVRNDYDVTVAVGDTYALLMTSIVRAPAVFVGTAKSVRVAPYGKLEERVLGWAAACFVRDEPTAHRLAAHGLRVEPAANVIVDLFATGDDSRADLASRDFQPALALFPGSRASAYDDASFLLEVTCEAAGREPSLGAVLSIARGLDPKRFAEAARRRGFDVMPGSGEINPFSLASGGRVLARAWTGALGPVLRRVDLVLGQAGTANEAAAAAGVPVVAFANARAGKNAWYRRRQQGLLGDALAVFPAMVNPAAEGVLALLRDPVRRARMAETGKAQMGPPGAARRIAQRIAAIASRG